MVGSAAAPTLAGVRSRLLRERNEKDALFLQRFFRTAPGEYGHGDQFLGIRVPATRAIAKDFRGLPIADLEKLLHDKWHEARLLALVMLAEQFEKGTPAIRSQIARCYLANTRYINNWDLVDASAPAIVGGHLEHRSRALLDRLAKSEDLWERRIAIVATLHFIRRDEYDDTLRIAAALLRDPHDLIHKATGWMLRETGKRSVAALRAFLAEHAAAMPRTMLRYSIERLTPEERARWMDARKYASGKVTPPPRTRS